MKVSGRMENNMEKVLQLLMVVNKWKDYGKVEEESNGLNNSQFCLNFILIEKIININKGQKSKILN